MVKTGENSERVIFRGNAFEADKYGYFIPLGFMLLFSFLLFGVYWLRMAMIMLVLVSGNVFLFYLIRRSSNWFSFDDKNQRMLKSLRQSIPYQKVKTIHVVQTPSYLSVAVSKGRHDRTPLVQGLDLKEKRRLIEELNQRFPEEMLHLKRSSGWRIILPIVIMCLIPCAGFLWMTYWTYSTSPEVRVMPQRKNWETRQNLLLEHKKYGLEHFSFSLPRDFELVKEENQELVFEDSDGRLRLCIVIRSSKFTRVESWYLVEYGLGWRDIYDVLKGVYYARFGVALLMCKGLWLDESNKAGIYEIDHNGLKGFLTLGRKKAKNVATIMLVDKDKERELDFYLTSSKPIDDETLAAIIGSIRANDQSGN